jgi:hypothetical protein
MPICKSVPGVYIDLGSGGTDGYDFFHTNLLTSDGCFINLQINFTALLSMSDTSANDRYIKIQFVARTFYGSGGYYDTHVAWLKDYYLQWNKPDPSYFNIIDPFYAGLSIPVGASQVFFRYYMPVLGGFGWSVLNVSGGSFTMTMLS